MRNRCGILLPTETQMAKEREGGLWPNSGVQPPGDRQVPGRSEQPLLYIVEDGQTYAYFREDPIGFAP